MKSPEEIVKIKTQIQFEARIAIHKNFGSGLVTMATGVGKSKVPIDYAKEVVIEDDGIALLVPTEKLRDENWKLEFEKWEASDLWDKTTSLCYASASKIKGKKYSLAIVDECHNITELSLQFFIDNDIRDVICLTATEPEDESKRLMIQQISKGHVYDLPLDKAVELGIVAPYNINIVFCELNDVDKTVKLATKNKHTYYRTEKAHYEYLTSVINNIGGPGVTMTMSMHNTKKFRIMERMRFIYDLKSKTDCSKYILDNLIPKDDRTLIFCGSIDQTIALCNRRYFSRPSYSKKDAKPDRIVKVESQLQFYEASKGYNDFKKGKINRLSVIKAVNEGDNIEGLDSALVAQLTSKELDLIQRLGRIIRYRDGHSATMWIVCALGTQDFEWLQSAISSFDKERINYFFFDGKKVDSFSLKDYIYEQLQNIFFEEKTGIQTNKLLVK